MINLRFHLFMLKNSVQKGLKQVSTTITIHREIPRQIKSERRKGSVRTRRQVRRLERGGGVRFCDAAGYGLLRAYLALVSNANLIRWINHFNVTRPYVGTGRATADNERIVKADVRGKKKGTVGKKKEGRKLVFLRSSTSRGAFCVAIIKAEVTPPFPPPSPFPPLSLSRLDDVVVFLSKTDHRTEKAERARNFTQCQEIKVSLYIRLYSFSIPHVLPPSPLFSPCLSPLLSVLMSGRIKSTLRGGKKKISHPTRRLKEELI